MPTFKRYDDIEIDIDGEIYVDDVSCKIEIEIDVYPAEPYSWGASRGTEADVSASITEITIGKLTLKRADAEKMFGPDALERADRAASDHVIDNLTQYDEAA